MSIKVINNDQAPSRKNRHSIIYDLPEFGEVLDSLQTLPPGKTMEVALCKESLAKIGVAKSKVSYFGQTLRHFFKDNRMPFTAWSRSFADGSERCYVQRTESVRLHARAAS